MTLEHKFEQLQLLYELTQAVNRADEPGEIYHAAVEGLVRALAADGASVMIFDTDGVMRYKVWKGISDRHRAMMERPISIKWRRGARNVQTVTVADVRQEPSLSALLPEFANEGIRSLALIPLLGNGGLIGKFVLYYNEPHEFLVEELQLAQTIATHVAFAAERHLAEAALRESEERFRNMADTAPVMIWVTGPDKLFNFVNETWVDFTGRTMEQELGNGWAVGLHPDDQQRCCQAFHSAFDVRRSVQLEYRLRRRDGEYRSILCSGVPRFTPGGTFAGYIGSNIDITDLQSEQRFRQLAENIDQVFWMLDVAREQILYVSPAFQKVWGCSSATGYQNHCWLLESVHIEDRDRFTAFLAKVKSEPAEESYRIIRPDGSVRWIQDRAFPIYDAEGKPYRVAGIAEDVTAHRELEEQLRQAHKMEAVGRLAGGIAHDFNNLLTVIGGYSQMLLNSTPAAGPTRERVEQILNAANRASTLTRQLLAFSRRQMWQPRVVSLNRLLTDMEPLLRPLIGEHITIETELAPELSCVKVDPHQIEQVVMNLATNARDAMPNGGRFRIQTSVANVAAMRANNSPSTGFAQLVRLRISDTGCGMDDRTRERAFEPFFTTKGLGKGTGLGLSTVYGIVRQNQGEIHVSSELGRGTAFDLYFPSVPEPEAESEFPLNELPKTAATETILVAEDERGVRELVKQSLEQLGYRVLEAADGNEALRVVEQHPSHIHLLLTDVIMPSMNGHELATRLRSVRPGTKVLYMSGYADDVLAFHGIDRPEIAFIQKPFTAAELEGKVGALLRAGKRISPRRSYSRNEARRNS